MSRMFACVALCAATPLFFSATAVAAEEFETVTQKSEFVSLIDGRDLKRFAISLEVKPNGEITGKGFGRDVKGDWRWEAGYFCRDLFWGETDLGFNCQKVLKRGETLRFIENRGEGRYADLRLE